MIQSTVALLALFGASASALSAGSAHVVNMCKYDVYLCNVPAAGGGQEQEDKTLASGDSWSQSWTQLTNGNGWSIKLSKTSSLDNILQYEYTYQNDGTIWYDLSCVNGNPWDKNWEITSSSSSCNPKQQAYRFATDDAYGMQSCPADSSITVTLCSGETSDNGTDGNADSGSAPSYSAPVYSAPAEITPAASAPSAAAAVTYGYNWNDDDVSASLRGANANVAATPTTFATQVTQVGVAPNGDVVNEVETVYVTDVVTAYAAKPRARRHEHHAHHRHA